MNLEFYYDDIIFFYYILKLFLPIWLRNSVINKYDVTKIINEIDNCHHRYSILKEIYLLEELYIKTSSS